jgi:hypothetical protein
MSISPQDEPVQLAGLRALKLLMATVPFAAQGFGMESLAEQPETCCPIVELRQYTLHPGKRDVLIDLFDREFVESQEALGMKIIGQFRDLDNPNQICLAARFSRHTFARAGAQGFYGGPVWKAHREAANATMIDSDNVLLLRPATPTSAFSFGNKERSPVGANDTRSELVMATIYYFDAPVDAAFVQYL